MKSTFRHSLVLLLVCMINIQAFAQTSNLTNRVLCQKVLDWVYKDLTVKNLDKSIERTKKKLLASVLSTLQNFKNGSLDENPELAKMWLSMKELDPEFESYLKKNKPYRSFINYGFFDWLTNSPNPDDVEIEGYFNLVKQWKDLQENKPEYFSDLPENLKLDSWDLATSKLVDEIGSLDYENQDILQDIKDTSRSLKSLSPNSTKRISNKSDSIETASKKLDQIQKQIMDSVLSIYSENFEDYKDYCSKADFKSLIITENAQNFCPANLIDVTPRPTIKQELSEIADILNAKDLKTIYRPVKPILIEQDDPVDEDDRSFVDRLCPIKIDYFKTKKPTSKATYNMRGADIVDTIVVHHTGEGTNLKTNAEAIHKMHVNRTTENSPWYMVGYNYLIGMGSNGSSLEKPAIIQGRNPAFRGAHAGGDTLPLPPEEINSLYSTFQSYNCKEDLSQTVSNQSKITSKNICEDSSFENNDFKCAMTTTNIADINNDGSLSGNMTSIGIAVVGNFDTQHTRTFFGTEIYRAEKVNISEVKYALVPKLVALVEALKKDYPEIKKIVPHNYFKNTACPGTVQEILAEVAKITGLEVYLSKAEEFKKYRNTKYKHLEKVKIGNTTKYRYKPAYSQFISLMKKIKTHEAIILEINTEIFMGSLSSNHRSSEIKKANQALQWLYNQKDQVAKELKI